MRNNNEIRTGRHCGFLMHVHLLVNYPPKASVSMLVNSLRFPVGYYPLHTNVSSGNQYLCALAAGYRTCFFESTIGMDFSARLRRVSSCFALPTQSANSFRCE